MTTREWTNERGNRVVSRHVGGQRYHYDLEVCTPVKGWQQYDTVQDAWYFGVWVSVADREIVTFAEGDEITVKCPTVEMLKAELQHMADFYGPPPPAFTVIDTDTGSVTEIFDCRPEADK